MRLELFWVTSILLLIRTKKLGRISPFNDWVLVEHLAVLTFQYSLPTTAQKRMLNGKTVKFYSLLQRSHSAQGPNLVWINGPSQGRDCFSPVGWCLFSLHLIAPWLDTALCQGFASRSVDILVYSTISRSIFFFFEFRLIYHINKVLKRKNFSFFDTTLPWS